MSCGPGVRQRGCGCDVELQVPHQVCIPAAAAAPRCVAELATTVEAPVGVEKLGMEDMQGLLEAL